MAVELDTVILLLLLMLACMVSVLLFLPFSVELLNDITQTGLCVVGGSSSCVSPPLTKPQGTNSSEDRLVPSLTDDLLVAFKG